MKYKIRFLDEPKWDRVRIYLDYGTSGRFLDITPEDAYDLFKQMEKHYNVIKGTTEVKQGN